jgi:hypothetical protein
MRKRIYVDLGPDDSVIAAGVYWYPHPTGKDSATWFYELPAKELRWSTQYLVSILLEIAHDGPGDYYETDSERFLPFTRPESLDLEEF